MKTSTIISVPFAVLALCASGWEGSVDGGRLGCDFVADGVVRVQFALGDKLEANGTGVVPQSSKCEAESRMSEVECPAGTIRLTGGDLAVEIDKASGRVVFKDVATGRVLLAESANNPHAGKRVNTDKVIYDEKSARTEHTANGDVIVKDVLSRKKGEDTTQYQVRFDWGKDESLYGLGQHVEDYLDLRGKEQFLTQHNLKIAVPVLVSTAGYGLLFDAGSAMRFDDKGGAGLFEIEAAKELDYYFIKGPTLDDVIARYRKLTGECPMLPRYAFGYVQSKERYRSSDEIIATLKRYRDLEVPIDVIVQDWNYWPQGWGYMKMNPKHYPDRPALAKAVHDLNGRLMVSIWPNPQNCPQEKDFRDRGFMRPIPMRATSTGSMRTTSSSPADSMRGGATALSRSTRTGSRCLKVMDSTTRASAGRRTPRCSPIHSARSVPRSFRSTMRVESTNTSARRRTASASST